ncbi:MAG TPA: hypothetical protein VL048_17555 [Xanthobacteraceae bacterium]|nr:hypothetical protein [Xanthobacteraceae bacterium]
MPKAANAIENHNTPSARAADNDVLGFLSRTLQAHFLDAKPQDVLTKLQNLEIALEQQESTLSAWPDSPSKSRICKALAKARNAVSQIVEDLSMAARNEPERRAANSL